MRFAYAHKAATYLVVGFSLLAMISGGGISRIVSLAAIAGLVLSWWWEPPRVRFERWSWLWTGASLVALAYSVLMAVATGDYLGIGGAFLMWLAIAKAFNRRAARDWQQLYLLSFLMLVAGSVLNANLTYGVCFLASVIWSKPAWALTLFHLRREMEDNLLVKQPRIARASVSRCGASSTASGSSARSFSSAPARCRSACSSAPRSCSCRCRASAPASS